MYCNYSQYVIDIPQELNKKINSKLELNRTNDNFTRKLRNLKNEMLKRCQIEPICAFLNITFYNKNLCFIIKTYTLNGYKLYAQFITFKVFGENIHWIDSIYRNNSK